MCTQLCLHFKSLKVQGRVLSGAFLVTRLRSRLSKEVLERWRLRLAKQRCT